MSQNMSQAKTQMTIGEVLKTLREEFADVSISKIRFLETEGLIDPERTASGYRKFYPADVARLRYILRLQRDHFMPLKVIRKRLETFDPAESQSEAASGNGSGEAAERPAAPELAAPNIEEDPALLEGGLSLSWEEFLSATGLAHDEVAELEEYGLVESRLLDSGDLYYNEDDLQVAKIAKEFGKYGIQARHLRMYKNFAEKELGLFEQVIVPTSRNQAEGRRSRTQSLAELAKLSRRLKQVLLRSSLRGFLERS